MFRYPTLRLLISHILIIIVLTAIFIACNDEQVFAPVESKTGKGVFIVNEGTFQASNGSLSYYDPVTKTVENKVFYRVNQIPLGDVAQSMIIHDSLGYVVLNNSGKVMIININTFEYAGSIKGLTSPRYIRVLNDSKGYISDLYSRTITIFNPQTFELTRTISTTNYSKTFNQHSTEQMVIYNNYLFTNCWNFDNQILVIDTQTDQVVDSIEVGVQPQSMVLDKYHVLWVLTDGGYKGNPFGYEQPELVAINAETRTIEQTFRFALENSPTELQLNGTADTLYFLNHGVWLMDVVTRNFPTVPAIDQGKKLFYSLGIDPVTSEIYVGDAIDYLQPGTVYRYSPQGEPIDTLKAGVVPGSFCFKE